MKIIVFLLPGVAVPDFKARQDSVVSAKSAKEAGEATEAFTSEERDVENAGWNVMLKYFKVRKAVLSEINFNSIA